MSIRLEDLNRLFDVLVFALPIVVGLTVYVIMRARRDRRGPSSGAAITVARNARGGYEVVGAGDEESSPERIAHAAGEGTEGGGASTPETTPGGSSS